MYYGILLLPSNSFACDKPIILSLLIRSANTQRCNAAGMCMVLWNLTDLLVTGQLEVLDEVGGFLRRNGDIVHQI
jgi:hypothetical protein